MTSTETKRPEQIADEKLADLYSQELSLLRKRAMYADSILRYGGGKVEYERRGRGFTQWIRDTKAEAWGTRLTYEVARQRVDQTIAENPDEYFFPGSSGSYMESAKDAVAKIDEIDGQITTVRAEFQALEASYTGWSRFFLVTSSRGHIHSSMHCSTCHKGTNPTTFGWLPHLSGQSEAEAVDELGPNLCSVCFPSAPTEWVGGWITKAQAEKKAAS